MNNRYLRLGVISIMWRRSGMPAAVSIPIRSGLHLQLPRQGPMVSRRIFARIGGT